MISQLMGQDHKSCDRLFAEAENQVQANDWKNAAIATQAFIDSMEKHLTLEEELLFPAFEAKTGMTQGPTQMMRSEHQQMRSLFDAMSQAIEAKAQQDFFGNSETLMILMQQHNMKEENILYPMCDAHLASEQSELMLQISQQLSK